MKFSKLSQLFLVSMIGLAVATLLTACQIVTIDYVFVANSSGSGSNSAGQVQTYDADSESGALRIGQPAVPSGGSNPVSMAASSDFANLYVANQGTGNGNGNVVHFALNGNGVLTQKDTVTPSTAPVSIAVNSAITYLYAASGTTSATLTAYPLTSGAMGTAAAQTALIVPGYAGDTIVPTAVTVLANNNAVYVTAYDKSAYNPGGTTNSTANPGWIFGFSVGSGGALTPIAGSPYKAGVKPSAVADPRGKYIYVANMLDSTVGAYVIDLATGTPSGSINTTGSASNSTDTQPVAIVVDAALARFVYTANHLGDSVSGFRLNTDTGAMSPTQATPYPTGAGPAAIVSVPNGNHALQLTTP